jgi:nitroreductase
MLAELVRRTRSHRRFRETERLERADLEALVDLARLTPSARNLQPLRYRLVVDPAECAAVFATLGWAGYLESWPGPAEGERPAAYIVILGDGSQATECAIDLGIATQTLLLGAAERGIAGCPIGSIRRDELQRVLALPVQLTILLVAAFGRPGEAIVLEELPVGGDHRYWRDDAGVHHVPKRSLRDVIVA